MEIVIAAQLVGGMMAVPEFFLCVHATPYLRVEAQLQLCFVNNVVWTSVI